MARLAVVLFNLGGPDGPAAVRPFLFNLFNDRAIISLPSPLRWLLARVISARRAPVARAIYAHLGGASPLLSLTREQAVALEAALAEDAEAVRVFVCMRYWQPMSAEVAAEVADWQADEVVLLPLYPQFSTTSTASSLDDWRSAAAGAGLTAASVAVGCYPTLDGLVDAHAEGIAAALDETAGDAQARVLFSAHGLPEVVIARGDPYQWQVEQTAAAVVAALGRDGLDWTVCYQSRVGPRRWLGPSIDDEIRRAGRDGVALVVVPIAFVSEHSETLVELDIDYRALAAAAGVPGYVRVPALGTHGAFIEGLAGLVRESRGASGVRPQGGARLCPARFARCPCGSR